MKIWQKVDHFTGEPYKKNGKSGAWYVVDYECGELRITTLGNGDRLLTNGAEEIGTFKTVKAAKKYAETV